VMHMPIANTLSFHINAGIRFSLRSFLHFPIF
jgi:hypothetical protein